VSLRLLFDECLWPGLVRQAVEAGHWDSTCLRDRGLLGTRDEHLMPRIIEGDFTFVTLNARDFRGAGADDPGGLYLHPPLHAGLIVLEAERGELTRSQQLELMAHGLEVLARLPDLINQVLELRLNADGSIESWLYEHPTALRPRTPEDGLP
jgi:hypothetical protein